jgi:hypothetical protein
MFTKIIRQLAHDLRPVTKQARLLYWGAAFWLTIGAIHLIPLARDGWTWSGPLSFRKPIVFSVSMGLLLATTGWVLDRLPERPRLAGALAWTFLISSTIEVALITTQAWRGRASHFNVFENGDAMIFGAMGVAVGFMSLCLFSLFIWSLVERPADRLVRIAVIAGLALVMTGLGIGQMMIELGHEFVASHQAVPDVVTYGGAGEPKFPHAVAFHGIQVFIVAAALLGRSAMSESARRRSMLTIVGSYTAALVVASVQTILGQAPTEPTIWTAGLVVAIALVVATYVRIYRSVETANAPDRQPMAGVR